MSLWRVHPAPGSPPPVVEPASECARMIHYRSRSESAADHLDAIRGVLPSDQGLAETSDGREVSHYADFVTEGRRPWRLSGSYVAGPGSGGPGPFAIDQASSVFGLPAPLLRQDYHAADDERGTGHDGQHRNARRDAQLWSEYANASKGKRRRGRRATRGNRGSHRDVQPLLLHLKTPSGVCRRMLLLVGSAAGPGGGANA